MNTTLLIDALVRQTTVLIAALATTTGQRTPLSRVANQVFGNLVAELKSQGLGNKVIADMFGMALRTYHHRMARLQESQTDAGKSLWEAVLRFVEQGGTVTRGEVLQRFRNDDGVVVRGILRDLVESRLVYQSGRGDGTVYRAADTDEPQVQGPGEVELAATLLQVALHRHGPASADGLQELLPLTDEVRAQALQRLLADGVVQQQGPPDDPRYHVQRVYVPVGDAGGWQAALFDHFQAVVTAMVVKLRQGQGRSDAGDVVGGSTYHFEVWPGHPLEAEVMGLLRNFRRQAVALRSEVQRYNDGAEVDAEHVRRVIAYVGQTVLEDGEREDELD